MTATLLETNMPEFCQKNVLSGNIDQLEHDVHVVNEGRAGTMDW